MSLYFYTDPLAAAWMAKHFGMKLYCRHDDAELAEYELPEDQREYPFGHAVIDDGCTAETWGVIVEENLGRRAYIHRDSLLLLEPQAGDLVLFDAYLGDTRLTDCVGAGLVHRNDIGLFVERPKFRWLNESECLVIQRNGIPFHWPESEAL